MTAKPSTRASLSAVAVSIALVAASFANASPANASSSSELALLRLVNGARTSHGVAPLKLNVALSRVARTHSLAMARAHRLFHTSPLQNAFTGFSWHVGGENVGYAPHASTMYRAFMASAPHRANILYRTYRTTGIGCVWAHGTLWCTQEFLG